MNAYLAFAVCAFAIACTAAGFGFELFILHGRIDTLEANQAALLAGQQMIYQSR